MKLSEFFLIPFILQGLAMFVDEFHFHLKRNLPRWERIGHPLDTLSVLACYLFLLLLTPNETNLWIYLGLCSLSCLCVTKDEFVHSEHCHGAENWLHSVLFVLHPIVFAVAGFIWFFHRTDVETTNLWTALQVQVGLTFFFLIYQITYWNFICKTKPI